MKITRAICLILFCLLRLGAFAQPASKAAHNQGAEAIQAQYNALAFHELYGRLSPNFKADLSESDFHAFLKNDLYTPLGSIDSLELLEERNNAFVYVVHFKQGLMQMILVVNLEGEIEGLQFLPYALPAAGKIMNYASDNKKQSGLDLFIDSLVTPYLQSPQNCGLSIGLRLNGVDYFYNYGETQRGSKTLPDQNTIYEIGSLSKSFCGQLLAIAVTEGKIKLEDDVRDYLPGKYPDLRYGDKPLRIKHLSNHTSGLPRIPQDLFVQPGFDSLNPYKHYSREQTLRYLKTVTPNQEPGTVCEYSNLGMALLGIILSDMYHLSFENLLKQKITTPLGMSSTGITLSAEQTQRLAAGYNSDGKATPHWELGDMAAAGGIRSSSRDMLTWLGYNLAEGDAPTRLAHQVTYSARETMGLAWFIKKTTQGNTLWWHNGGTYGFTAFEGCLKEKNAALIILSNSGTHADHLAIAILNYLQK